VFTGIIQAVGTVKRLTRKGEDLLLMLDAPLDLTDMGLGESIAVNGACLTITDKAERGFTAFVSAETLLKTNLSTLKAGDRVNLEKALRMSDFLSGHIVLGHVDGQGRIIEKTVRAHSIIIGVEVEEKLGHYVVEKGSVTIDGISLTVNRCEKRRFYVNIIPHTAQLTTLGAAGVGKMVNIETDILGKYVEQFVRPGEGMDRDFLKKHGLL